MVILRVALLAIYRLKGDIKNVKQGSNMAEFAIYIMFPYMSPTPSEFIF